MTANSKPALRGQPLFVFGALMVGWIGMRAFLWDAPFPVDFPKGAVPILASSDNAGRDVAAVPAEKPIHLHSPLDEGEPGATGAWRLPPVEWGPPQSPDRIGEQVTKNQNSAEGEQVSGPFAPVPPRVTASHVILMAAGFSSLPLPQSVVPYVDVGLPSVQTRLAGQERESTPYPAPFATRAEGRRRWSADGWLLWRDDTTTPITSGRPSYGRSQAGAVARFELAPSSRTRPQAYLRGSSTIEGARDVEGAVGLSARPLPGVPVRVAVEMRLADRPEGSELRPAAFAITELPPVPLPAGLDAELYLQGGYVGGNYATAFADGQARLDGSLVKFGDLDLRAGAGAWGGAQEDALRLDLGPSASVRFRIGDANGRLAADYRFRVAGDAEPASGPALTLSAGF